MRVADSDVASVAGRARLARLSADDMINLAV
jgi:hypothetical protein